MKKVLVTGAAGQVGSRLVRQLLARNYEVKGLILPNDVMKSRIEGLDIEVVEGNLLDHDVATKSVSDVDAVVHTANLVGRPQGMTESEFFDNNVRSTFNIVHAASKRADEIVRFVHISSNSVYPAGNHIMTPCYSPIDELHPLRAKGLYALTKLLGEDIINAHARENGLKTAMIRPSGIWSGANILKGWNVNFVCGILKSGQNNPESGLYMSDGTELWHALEKAAESPNQLCAITDNEGRPWLYQLVDARDVALGCVCALESPCAVGEVFNIAAPELISYPEAAQIISEATGQSVIEWKVPVRWVFDSSISKAKRLIGYRPRWGIEEMVHDAIALQRGESDGMT